jgi:hypothetical protein
MIAVCVYIVHVDYQTVQRGIRVLVLEAGDAVASVPRDAKQLICWQVMYKLRACTTQAQHSAIAMSHGMPPVLCMFAVHHHSRS